MTAFRPLLSFFAILTLVSNSAWAAPAKKAAAKPKGKPAAAAPAGPAASAAPAAASSSSQAPTSMPAKPAVKGEGELGTEVVEGTYKGKLKIGKFDPPAAFNLEDIQNFPEDRLQPVLSNAITFEEGRDFSGMVENIDDQLFHPWLPQISRAPFLKMQPSIDQASRDWTFAVIDQSGGTVSQQNGKGAPPKELVWQGDDKIRDRAAVDTVYIPQILITNKDGYRRTYQGQPVQFASLMYVEKGKTMIEVSTKRLFQENKVDFTKEAPTYLDKVGDAIRENSFFPFAIQIFEPSAGLAQPRQQAVIEYLSDKLNIPESQITILPAGSPEKRGAVISVIANATPGGAGS